MIREGIHCRSALIGLVYKKSLIIAPHAKAELGTGRIINHQSTDANRLMELFYFSTFKNNIFIFEKVI